MKDMWEVSSRSVTTGKIQELLTHSSVVLKLFELEVPLTGHEAPFHNICELSGTQFQKLYWHYSACFLAEGLEGRARRRREWSHRACAYLLISSHLAYLSQSMAPFKGSQCTPGLHIILVEYHYSSISGYHCSTCPLSSIDMIPLLFCGYFCSFAAAFLLPTRCISHLMNNLHSSGNIMLSP